MISKETFCKALELIQEQEKIYREFGKSLHTVVDGNFVVGCENKYLDALILVLEEIMNDKYGYITWWLYEAEEIDKTVKSTVDNKSWDLITAENLYDYLIIERGENDG